MPEIETTEHDDRKEIIRETVKELRGSWIKRAAPVVALALSLLAVAGVLVGWGNGQWVTTETRDADLLAEKDAEAKRVQRHTEIETAHTKDIRDLLLVGQSQAMDMAVVREKQRAADEARERLERRVGRLEDRAHAH